MIERKKTAFDEIRDNWIALNIQYSDSIGAPNFLPHRGICYDCGRDIVAYYGDKCATTFITGCPYCHISFCE